MLYNRLNRTGVITSKNTSSFKLKNNRSIIYKRYRHKLTPVEDAVRLVKSHDSLGVSGFVAHSVPETLLEALGNRFRDTGEPNNLTLYFEGGPGDWDYRGLNHLGQEGMLKLSIGAHYGQVPKVAELVLQNKILGYALPMGSISRMYRSCASDSPGHITNIGLGTFVDPRETGGKLNEKTRKEGIDMVTLLQLDGREYLRYRRPNIRVAFIRATTADVDGNLTFEKETMYSDAKLLAMATRANGGIVIAEVQQIAEAGTLAARSVHIPGTLVDCIVKCKPEHMHMSYTMESDISWTGALKVPMNSIEKSPLDYRKIIAKRAIQQLENNDTVNLGIGMPESVATIAQEEKIFKNVTLTTESGIIGGIAMGGKHFGAGYNYDALLEINQIFDLYNGGGLNICFLGMASVNQKGDVNVSRLSLDKLTGPGGFIDITQPTRKVVFMGSFTKCGLKTSILENNEGNQLKIDNDGSIPCFQNELLEVTFSSKQALAKGQEVYYVTERAVFKLSYRGLTLVEIAPGMDLEKDILQHMEFVPYIKDRNNIPLMEQRIFVDKPMGIHDDWFSASKNIMDRVEYFPRVNNVYIDLSNMSVCDMEFVKDVESSISRKFCEFRNVQGHEKFHVSVNYDNFDISSELSEEWTQMASRLQEKYYETVVRYSSSLFKRQKLGDSISVVDTEVLWDNFVLGDHSKLSRASLRVGLEKQFHISPSEDLLDHLMSGQPVIPYDEFPKLLNKLSNWRKTHYIDH